MSRLSPLHLMISHTHLYTKSDEFGKDQNALIERSEECQYPNVNHQPTPTTCTYLGQVNLNKPIPPLWG